MHHAQLYQTHQKSSCILRIIESRLNRPSNRAAPSRRKQLASLVFNVAVDEFVIWTWRTVPSKLTFQLIKGAFWIPEVIPKRSINSLLFSPSTSIDNDEWLLSPFSAHQPLTSALLFPLRTWILFHSKTMSCLPLNSTSTLHRLYSLATKIVQCPGLD